MRFAGYKKPHPLEEKIEVKVQTNGEVAPPDAILQSCQQLNLTLGKLIDNFSEEILKYKGADAVPAGSGEDRPMQMQF